MTSLSVGEPELELVLPEFPNFKSLQLGDRKEVENVTKQFPPYSDFNFVNLWSWNIHDQIRISQLNCNLVVRFSCPATDHQFYSFFGSFEVERTAEQLLERCRSEGLEAKLRFIPEIAAKALLARIEDRDSFDYIWSVGYILGFGNKILRNKLRKLEKFKEAFPQYSIGRLNLQSKQTQRQIIELFERWQVGKNQWGKSAKIELAALKRCMALSEHVEFSAFGGFLNNALIGFSINEVVQCGYFISHFQKADPEFYGLGELMIHELAQLAQQSGCEYINAQEDLGVPGLREAKKAWSQGVFLKKYILAKAV